jgi:hypothetical protein
MLGYLPKREFNRIIYRAFDFLVHAYPRTVRESRLGYDDEIFSRVDLQLRMHHHKPVLRHWEVARRYDANISFHTRIG